MNENQIYASVQSVEVQAWVLRDKTSVIYSNDTCGQNQPLFETSGRLEPPSRTDMVRTVVKYDVHVLSLFNSC